MRTLHSLFWEEMNMFHSLFLDKASLVMFELPMIKDSSDFLWKIYPFVWKLSLVYILVSIFGSLNNVRSAAGSLKLR